MEDQLFKTPDSIESRANYEGNESLLLFERIEDDRIKSQIVELLVRGKVAWAKENEMVFNMGNDIDALRETIKADVEQSIEEVKFETRIAFEGECDEMIMVIGYKSDPSKGPDTQKQMSITEAHEKGHRVRKYKGKFFDEYFAPALDMNAMTFSEYDLVRVRAKVAGLPEESQREYSDEEIKNLVIDYLSDAREIAERMGQLKNYFGMKAGEEVTSEHVAYAREHYVSDTGENNWMTQFFQGITIENEGDFLKLINSSGI